MKDRVGEREERKRYEEEKGERGGGERKRRREEESRVKEERRKKEQCYPLALLALLTSWPPLYHQSCSPESHSSSTALPPLLLPHSLQYLSRASLRLVNLRMIE